MATEISVTDRLEVLVASTVCGEQIVSSLPKISRLRSRLSGTASTTSCAAPTSSRLDVNVMRPMRSACSCTESLPRATARPVDVSTCPRPIATASGPASTAMTSSPLRLRTSAIPAPIVPSPTTPTVRISRAIHVLLA